MSSLRKNYGLIAGGDGEIYSATMSSDGTPAGSFSLAVDGSVTPAEFWIQPPPTLKIAVRATNVLIGDNGASDIDEYGNVPALANGTVFWGEFDGVKEDLALNPFMTNGDWLTNGLDVFAVNLGGGGGGDRVITIREPFSAYSRGFILDGSKGEKFGIRIRDDLSSLVFHECEVKAGAYAIMVP